VKRKKLILHLQRHGCVILGEEGDHSRVLNPAKDLRSSVSRHDEINPHLMRKICKQLDVPIPPEN
jgi:mRNA interferase HicA